MKTTWAGALVDCTILIVALVAAHWQIITQSVFIGILFAIVGARAAARKREGSSVLDNSAALVLLAALGTMVIGAWHSKA